MTTEALKSAAITNLDLPVPLRAATGEGSEGFLRHVNGVVLVSAAMAAGSTYRMVRIPSNAKVKSVIFEAEAMGAGKFNLSVYYSDSTQDGTQVTLQGIIVPTTGDQFFASDVDCASAVSRTGNLNESGNNPLSKRNKALWDALGLTVDPGGFFDIVAVVHTTDVTTGAARIGVECEYIM